MGNGTLQVQNSKVSGLFAGTKDKCVTCNKTVYPTEKVITFTGFYIKIHNTATNMSWFASLKHMSSIYVNTIRPVSYSLLFSSAKSSMIVLGNICLTSVVFAGSCWWEILPQALFQVLPWRLCNQPIKLCSPWAPALLQASPQPALQGKRKLQPAWQTWEW